MSLGALILMSGRKQKSKVKDLQQLGEESGAVKIVISKTKNAVLNLLALRSKEMTVCMLK